MGFFKTLFMGKEDIPENGSNDKEKRDFDILKYDGIQALKMGKMDYAVKCMEHALALCEDVETRSYLAKALMAADKLDEAALQYELLHRLVPDEPSYPIALAELHFQLEKYDEMEQDCQTALEIDDRLARPRYLLAKKCCAQKDYINAIVQVTRAISAKEDFFDAYLLRAQILCGMMQYAEAEKDVDFVLNNTESGEDTLLQKAVICANLDRNEEAKDCFGDVISMNPFIPQAYVGLSGILVKMKNRDDALSVINEGIEQNPNSPELFRVRGGIKLMAGDKEGAAADMKKSLELAPEEERQLSGKFTNMEDVMLEAYNKINPYNFTVRI